MLPPHPPSRTASAPGFFHRLFLSQQRNHRREPQAFLYRLAASAFLFVIMMACLAFIIWVFVRPRLPTVNLVSASLSPLSITSNTTGLPATCNLTLLLININRKLSIYYQHLELNLLYQSQNVVLSQTLVPPFMQPKNNQTFIAAQFNVASKNLGNEVLQGVKDDLSRGTISFGVEIIALVRFKDGHWDTKAHSMRVNCDGLSFGFPSRKGPGLFLNPYKQCDVGL